MELLTRNNFEGWMQKLMERLDRQDELLLAMKVEERQPSITESIRLFDNQDLCMLLQISKRTLQRYRSVGALPYSVCAASNASAMSCFAANAATDSLK